MKTTLPSNINFKASISTLIFSFLGFCVHSQSMVQQSKPASNGLYTVTDTAVHKNQQVVKDTVACMFHQFGSKRPALLWRKGYIVLVNRQVVVNNQLYATQSVSTLTGLYGNDFLADNKKPLQKKNIIQVILLN